MKTAIENTKFLKEFLEVAQPLPVKYAYRKEVVEDVNFITFQNLNSAGVVKGIGNQLISEDITYLVVVQTETARENMIFSEMIKLATEGQNVRFISESPQIVEGQKNRCINNIILSLYSSIATEKVFYSSGQVEVAIQLIAERYNKSLQMFGIDFQNALLTAGEIKVPAGDYDFSEIVRLKQAYLDNLVASEALVSSPSNTRTSIQRAQLVKRFLETVQPLKVSYGYVRGIRKSKCIVTYKDMGTVLVNTGIGNQIISERTAFMVTVQTETAEQNMFYSELIKLGSEHSDVEFMSQNLRVDVIAGSGYINSMILYVYNSVHAIKVVYTAKEVQQLLQEIADRYIFVTSIYRADLAKSFIDKLKVPLPEDRLYGYDEVMEMKVNYLDKLLYKTTKF